MNLIFIIGILYVFVAFVGFLFVNKKPDLSFWLILNIYFDPGGYLSSISDDVIGRFDFQDIFIVFILYAILRINRTKYTISRDIYFSKFLKQLFLFSLYYFIIYGGIVPDLKGDFNYGTFLLKSRRFIYGIIILIGVYKFTLRGTKYLYITTLFVALPTMIFFWFTIITSIPFMEIFSMERYKESGILRIGLKSYGLILILFPVSVIVYFFNQSTNIKIKYKKLLYAMGVLIIISLFVSLTRRVILDIFGSLFIIGFLVSKISKSSVLKIPFKLIAPILILLVVLFIVKPNYLSYVGTVTTDTFLLLSGSEDTRGNTDQRVSGDGIYPEVYQKVKQNILFGNGYTYLHWESIESMDRTLATSTRGLHYGQLADAAHEIPILNMFFSFGVIGFLILLPLYLMIFRLAKKSFRLIKINFTEVVFFNPLLVIFTVLYVLFIAKLFTYNFWSLGDQFIGTNLQFNAFWFGLGFALLNKHLDSRRKL